MTAALTEEDGRALARLLRGRRLAALGTLHANAPAVSLAPYALAPDLSAFYLHFSQLAAHTQDLLTTPAASLLITAAEAEAANPLALARVSLHGTALPLGVGPAADAAQAVYLARFPQAAINFTLPDFVLFQFTPAVGRYVAGFGRIFDLTAEALQQAGALAA